MEKPKLHIVSLSGGKDSTAMLLRMLEEGMPVDIILFCDTGLEFDAMYKHIDKLEKYIGIPITRLKGKDSFEYLFFGLIRHSSATVYDPVNCSARNAGQSCYIKYCRCRIAYLFHLSGLCWGCVLVAFISLNISCLLKGAAPFWGNRL